MGKIYLFLLLLMASLGAIVSAEPIDCERFVPVVTVGPEDCCKLPKFFPSDILERCATDYSRVEFIPSTTPLRAPPLPAPLVKSFTTIVPRGCCIFECAFNVSGINSLQDGMDKTDISNYIGGIVANDTSWNDTIIDALEFCLKDTHSKLPGFTAIANMPPTHSGEKFCNPMAGYLMGCLHSYLFQKCPDNLWQSTEECNAVKIYQERCPHPFNAKKI
ncbi:hypothetical protein DMENIID0001_125820 [Sergentomyia squamirostris]